MASGITKRPSNLSKKSSDISEVPLLKARIKELEDQLADSKRRLDELRKAKNTTILKREREIIDVKAPQLGVRDSKLQDAKIAELEQKLKNQPSSKQDTSSTTNKTCGHESELKRLRETVDALNGENAALRMENEDHRERVECLVSELSVKEANWCETEEQLNLKLKQQWGEKYREWMQETEQKISDLQEANSALKAYINRTRPGNDAD